MATRAKATPEQADRVREGYLAGLSSYRLGEELGRSNSWVLSVLRQLDVPRRRTGEQPGRREPVVGYDAHHWRVEQVYGKPQECWKCGTTEDRRYEWANLTGHYEDVQDYARMCVPCHRNYDFARRKNQ
jgi:hypothetical protein